MTSDGPARPSTPTATRRRPATTSGRGAATPALLGPARRRRSAGAGCRRRSVGLGCAPALRHGVSRCSIDLARPRRGPGGRPRSRRRRSSAGAPSCRERTASRTSAMAIHGMRPVEEGGDRHLVGGVQPGRGGPADPAGLVGQAAGRGRRRGRAARSRAGRSVGPVDAPERRARCGRGRPGRSRWAGACRASTAGRWWRRR